MRSSPAPPPAAAGARGRGGPGNPTRRFPGPAPPRVSGGTVKWSHGNPYRLFAGPGTQTVAWLRQGRLCVLSGRGVDAATLIRLAGWGKHVSAVLARPPPPEPRT